MFLNALWRNVVRRDRVESELDEEMRGVHAMLVDEKIRAGMTPPEARRTAAIELGGVEQVKERVREMRAGSSAASILQDVRFGARTLRRNPGFAALAVLTLALGIGTVTAVYSVVYGVLFRQLPYPDADRIVRLSEGYEGALPLGRRGALFSNVTYHAWRDAGFRSIDGLEGYGTGNYKTAFNGQTERIWASAVTPGLFHLIGVTPALGRLFVDGDATDDTNRVVVLSDRLWRDRFNADPAIINRTMSVSGQPFAIVGVAPPTLAFPDARVSFWIPMVIPTPTGPTPNPRFITFRALVHLRPGMTLDQVTAEATTIARRRNPKPLAARLTFGDGGPAVVRAQKIAEDLTAGIEPALLVVTAGVTCLLLLISINLANLLLSRGVVRRRELALRAAIGAGRCRLVRELLAENLLIAALGCGLGIVIAVVLVRVAPALAPRDFPRLESVQVDARLPIIATIMAIITAIVISLAPALNIRQLDIAEAFVMPRALGSGSRTTARQLVMNVLLTMESAFCVVLLVAALLLARSFANLLDVDSGYTAEHAVAATIIRPGTDPSSATRYAPLMQDVLARVRAMPGVIAAAIASMTPLDDNNSLSAFPAPGAYTEADFRNPNRGPAPRTAFSRIYSVTPGYEHALGLRLRAGRFFTESDKNSDDARWVVNEEFARRYLPPSPAGMRFPWIRSNKPIQLEIIGIVGNVLKEGNDARAQPEVYALMHDDDPFYDAQLVVRTTDDPADRIADIRRIVREVTPDAGTEFASLNARLDDSVAQARFATVVFVALAAFSLALGAVGLVAALTYHLSQRRREFGIRMAAGASRTDLVRLAIRQGLMPTAAGVVIGLIAASLAAQLMRGVLFGIAPLDAVSFLAGPAILIPLAILACLVPALQAARLDPIAALRCE